MTEVTLSRADHRDLDTALRALDRFAKRHSADWEDYEFDALSAAQQAIREWQYEHDPGEQT